jgi:hypothetical protein
MEWAKDIPSKVVGWLTRKKIGVHGKNPAGGVIH